MTQPGWYPDQNGGPDMKYWDGQAWHDAIPGAPANPTASADGKEVYPKHEPVVSPGSDPEAPTPASWSNAKRAFVSLIAVGVIVGGIGLINWSERKARTGHANEGTAFSQIADASPQEGDINYPLMVFTRQIKMDGSIEETAAGVTVDSLQAAPSGPLPVRGQLFAARVTFEVTLGSFTVNPFYFAARTETAMNLMPTATIGNDMLPAAEIPARQKVSGWITFDVPNGQHIAEIVLHDPLGKQLARWLVK